MDKGMYFDDKAAHLLGYIHQVIQKGFQIGNLNMRFIGYSNSQLKNHSCWFLCCNNPVLKVSEEQVFSYMGNFERETNILKRMARKGQFFSTSKFIC